MSTNNPESSSPDSGEKQFAALSYLWLFSVMILIAKRDSHFILHHARRGFVLFVFSILIWLFPPLHYGEFLILVLSLYGFITAAMGNENPTPILSEIADGTLRMKHLRHYWHHAKHGAIKAVRPEHITPMLKEELREQHKELTEQEKILEQEKKLFEMEEKKLSALLHRVEDDEKKIDKLEQEVQELKK